MPLTTVFLPHDNEHGNRKAIIRVEDYDFFTKELGFFGSPSEFPKKEKVIARKKAAPKKRVVKDVGDSKTDN